MLIAAMLLSATLGSVHAFSVLIGPIEATLDLNRSTTALTYSLALIALTVAVLFGHRFYDRFSPAIVAGIAALGAAGALAFAALWTSQLSLWLGYGLLFGATNGLGYGFALVLSARAFPARSGLAMGATTAVYAVGAAAAASLLSLSLEHTSLSETLLLQAGTLGLTGLVVVALLKGIAQGSQGAAAGEGATAFTGSLTRYWLAYFCCVLAGLMAIGHAAPILAESESGAQAIASGAVILASGNAAGGLVAGWLFDRLSHHRLPHHRLIAGLAMLSAIGLCALAMTTGPIWMSGALATVGFSYGAIIAVFPPTILKRAGGDAYAKAYGRVFTAWGLAGFLGPTLAGIARDVSGTYTLALLGAAAIALVGVGLALSLDGE
jgi:OFA family oxalate/formate antiporter-like MFS transporter